MRRPPALLLLCLVVLARPATAQIDTPNGVGLSPFAVLQSPPGYSTFGDGQRGVWGVFLSDQPGSALYAQHLRSDGSFDLGFDSTALALTDGGTLVNNSQAAMEGAGGAAVMWFGVNPRDPASPFLALRYTHLEPGGTIASGIADTGLVVSKIASAAMVVGDDAGGAYVVWEELKSASNPDIYAQHYDYHGAATWIPSGSPSGRSVCAAVGLQRLRALVPDGSGGAFVVWADSRSGAGSPLYVARLLAGGVAGAPWPTNGVRVTPITTGIRIVGSANSTAGGLWLAWRDINVPGQFEAQHVAPDGTFLWAALGAIVATAAPPHADFVPASSGHVFVTWGGADLRCSRLDASGARVWTSETGGRVLVASPYGSLSVKTVSDAAGGQRLAWAFDNAGQSDVYTLHVDGSGAPWPGEPVEGELFEGGPQPEVPVAWLLESGAEPLLVWLTNGQLRVRRLPGASLGVEPPLARGPLALAPPAPNPFRGETLLARFTAPPGRGSLEIFDLEGRRLREQPVVASGGPQAVSIPGLGALPPGVYTLRLSAAAFSVSRRVVRMR